MIQRYWSAEMRVLWETNQTKFTRWLDVERAVLRAREQLGQLPAGTAEAIASRTWMDADVARAIERRDQGIHHDLNAFVEIVRLQLILSRDEFIRLIHVADEINFHRIVVTNLARQGTAPFAGWFHDGMTSYDTEEPAMALLLIDSCKILRSKSIALQKILENRAQQHRGIPMIGRTHGQHAQPITFGVKLLVYRNLIQNATVAFENSTDELRVMKLSGAVGMFGTLGPDVEQIVGDQLNLEPVIATQIVSLDRRARLVNEMAVLASVLEKIAFDLWLLSQTEVGEIREPFGRSQKGSSAMPHKKNPITLEKIRGLARVIRGHAGALMENIATTHERDISHSSVERLALVDAFGVLDHMLEGLTHILANMEVFPDRMRTNLDATYGTIASQRAEMWLKQQGMPAELAYRTVQSACATAMEQKRGLRNVLLEMDVVHPYATSNLSELERSFDWNTWIQHETFLFEREGVSLE